MNKYPTVGRLRRFFTFVAMCIWASAGWASDAARQPLLDHLLSLPLAGDLTAARRSDSIAWTEYQAGRRSIWIASTPQFQPRELVVFDGDTGQEISQLTFSHDDSTLYFVRGSWISPEGLYPNPESLVIPTDQLIWRVSVAGGPAQPVVPGSMPLPHPTRADLAFERDGSWFLLSAQALNQQALTPTPLFHARGGIGELAWAPDGSRAVFVSSRGRHNFIGLYTPGEPSIRWVAPDVSRDRTPMWSPDGRSIAWLRFPGAERNETFSFQRNAPFGVWVYDVSSQLAREVWRSPNDDGNRNTNLHWASNRTLVVDSEHDGWRRAYGIDVATGRLKALMPNACELFERAVSPEKSLLVLATNCADSDRYHLARVDVSSGSSRPLTAGDTVESGPVILPSGQFVAYVQASAGQPPSVHLLRLASGESRGLRPKAALAASQRALAVPRSVTFPSASEDGAPIHGLLFGVNDAAPLARNGKRPAIIYVHGGPAAQMTAAWTTSVDGGMLYAFNQFLVSRGYLVLSINYRASEGYGKAYRTTKGLGAHGALEYRDVLGGARYLASLGEVDAERIGIYGDSFGGNVVSMALARSSDVFAAGVSFYGYVDYLQRAEEYMPGGGWGIITAEDKRVAWESSPIAYAGTWRAPTLFIHADDDLNVEFSHTVSAVARLRALGAPVEVISLPDEGHGFWRHSAWLTTLHRAGDFLDEHVGNRKVSQNGQTARP